jgi:hypothetical protein
VYLPARTTKKSCIIICHSKDSLLVFFSSMPTYDMLILIIDSYYCLIYISIIIDSQSSFDFFANYTIHRRHSQRTHTHPYEYTHANPTPRSIFEDCAGESSRLTKSPQVPRCRRERRLPLKAPTPLNPEKFAPTRSQTQDLRCYRGSCNH